MNEETWISEGAAFAMLRREGDYTEGQARIILGHSRRKAMFGGDYYPLGYIAKRAREGAARPNRE
jgi:hypothetical protein